MSKNLQEYVSNRIIEHLKDRDTELQELRKFREIALSLFGEIDIVMCSGCKMYSRWGTSCDLCDNILCVNCDSEGITHYNTWNLSGTNACKECQVKHKDTYLRDT